VIYAGADTKIQKNSAKAKNKKSRIELHINKQIIIIFLIQVFLCVVGAAIGATWMIMNLHKAWYLDFNEADQWSSNWFLLFIKTTGTWILIFTNFVPISLLVTLELVKFW